MRKRPSARLLVFDPDYRVLLFHFVFDDGPLAGQRYWATPGGALERGESFREAARRELYEETGIAAPIGRQVLQRTTTFPLPTGEVIEADERYFLVHVVDTAVDESGQEALESRIMKAHRWWSPEDLATTAETVFPEGLAALVVERRRMGVQVR